MSRQAIHSRHSACAAPRIRVAVRPRKVAAKAKVRLTIRVKPAIRARITVAGRRSGRTSSRGLRRISETFPRRGRVRITARAAGYRPGKAVLRVR